MKTRITESFGVKYPIFLSGMSWISVSKMVAAVSNTGGVRILATGQLHDNYKKLSIQKGVNDTVYSPRIDGILCRALDTNAARRAIAK